MHISALEEYGVRCAVRLASHRDSGPLPASKIAELEGLSVEYVSKIMFLLRNSGLIRSERGTQGGFFLVNDPREVNLTQVFSALKGKEKTSGAGFCDQYSGQQDECVHGCDCNIRPMWELIFSYVDSVLETLTLHDLAATEGKAAAVISNIALKRAKELGQRNMEAEGNR